MFKGMFTVFSGGAVPVFARYERPMEFFLARDWYTLGKDIVPGIRACGEAPVRQPMTTEEAADQARKIEAQQPHRWIRDEKS